MKKRKNNFSESAIKNKIAYENYVNKMTQIAVSQFEWIDLPDSCDVRYLETMLLKNGKACFFKDDVTNELLSLNCTNESMFDIYGYPVKFRAYSEYNNFQMKLTSENAVVIYNNLTKTNSLTDINMFAERLANIDRIIEINANAQKTPILLQCEEKQRLTLLNVYKEFDGNSPVIFADKNLDLNNITALSTNANYICDKLSDLKQNIWNEFLTYMGIANTQIMKRERVNTEEATNSQGGVLSCRYSRLEARQIACNKLNKLFGLNVKVKFKDELKESTNDTINISDDKGGKNIE